MNQSTRNITQYVSSLIILLTFVFIPGRAIAEEPKCRFVVPLGIQTKYDQVMCSLPIDKALIQLAELAHKNDCKAAHYLSSLAREKQIFDSEKHDGKYWADFALNICNEFERAEMGYPYKYTTTAEISAGKSRLEIRSFFNPLDPKITYPVCYEQQFLFYLEKKLLNRQIIKYRNIPKERLLVTTVFSNIINGIGYYIVESSNYGASCCEWGDVFNTNGHYIGSLNPLDSRFKVRAKQLPSGLFDAIYDQKTRITIRIDQYPTLY